MIERRSVPWAVAAGVLWLATLVVAHDAAALAGLGVLVVGPAIPRTLRALVAAIVVGAAAIGAIAGVAVAVVGGPLTPTVAAGVGAAVGGGAGSAVWLFVATDDEEETDVTVDVGETAPAPQPADLFEANPDPILFVGGPEPSVLAANPAFGDVFGVDPDDLEGRPLAESLQVGTDGDAIVSAVTDGRRLEVTRSCEVDGEPGSVRVRVVPTGGTHGAAYVVYGPVEAAAERKFED